MQIVPNLGWAAAQPRACTPQTRAPPYSRAGRQEVSADQDREVKVKVKAPLKQYKSGMRRRAPSSTSSLKSSVNESIIENQELDPLYDYLAKIILLGPSGCGKSCLLHRFVNDEWKVLSSQTIGVEFSFKIVKCGQGSRGVKLQIWDTAGQERFRSLTRGYYRGSAGVLLVYDITNRQTLQELPQFLADVRALTPPTVSVVVVANKIDVAPNEVDPDSVVSEAEARDFCVNHGNLPLVFTSAKSGKGVYEAFDKLASMILTKVELGTIDPEDMNSGVQYGDVPRWDGSVRGPPRSILTLMGGTRTQGQTQAPRRPCC